MIIDIKLLNHTGKNNYDSPSAELTYAVVSDDWEDGPLAIAIQGESDRIAEETGRILGWLPPGTPYRFGNQINDRIIATEVTVSDPRVLDADNEYDFRIGPNGLGLVRNDRRRALVQWTVKQRYAERPMEEETFTLKTSLGEVEKVDFLFDMRTGEPVVNSVGDFFPKWDERKIYPRIYTLTRKEQLNPVKKSDIYHRVVNSDDWYGAVPGTVLMTSILPEWDGTVWKVEYKFQYKEGGWGEKYLDEGFRHWGYGILKKFRFAGDDESSITYVVDEKNGRKLVPILNEGIPVSRAEKLNGRGHAAVQLDENGLPLLNEEGKTIPLEGFLGVQYPLGNEYYWKYPALPFAPLELPNPYFPVSKLQVKVPK